MLITAICKTRSYKKSTLLPSLRMAMIRTMKGGKLNFQITVSSINPNCKMKTNFQLEGATVGKTDGLFRIKRENGTVVVESGSSNAILWTRDHSKVPWHMKLISNTIETLSKSIRRVTFNYTSREINSVADSLTKAGVLRPDNFSTFFEPPG